MKELIPYGRQSIDEEDIRAVVEVLGSDWLTTGPQVETFEREFSDFVKGGRVPYTVPAGGRCGAGVVPFFSGWARRGGLGSQMQMDGMSMPDKESVEIVNMKKLALAPLMNPKFLLGRLWGSRRPSMGFAK